MADLKHYRMISLIHLKIKIDWSIYQTSFFLKDFHLRLKNFDCVNLQTILKRKPSSTFQLLLHLCPFIHYHMKKNFLIMLRPWIYTEILKTCRKFGSSKCRFNFPKFPSINTLLSTPLLHDISDEERKKKADYYENILSKV